MNDRTARSRHEIAILVVDDEALVRIFAVDFLEEAGFKVFEAPDADEALEILGARPDIHLVMTDVQMPGSMDGLGLAKVMRERWPGIPVIIASGRHKFEDGDLSDDVPVLTKPYLPETVLKLIEQKVTVQVVQNGQPSKKADGPKVEDT